MHKIRTIIAAGSLLAALGGGLVAASPAFACDSPTGACTSGSYSDGVSIGATGFPTSFTITGATAGVASTATANKAYGIFSNVNWKLSFTTDSSDLNPNSSSQQPSWFVGTSPLTATAAFAIPGTTTVSHLNGVTGMTTYALPSAPGGVSSVQIDAGSATSGGTSYTDSYTVTSPATTPPATFSANFDYVLAAA